MEGRFGHEKEAEDGEEKSESPSNFETSSQTRILYNSSGNWTRQVYSSQDTKVEKCHHDSSGVYKVVVRDRWWNKTFKWRNTEALEDSSSCQRLETGSVRAPEASSGTKKITDEVDGTSSDYHRQGVSYDSATPDGDDEPAICTRDEFRDSAVELDRERNSG
jgi:plasmid maintenance system killer protein